MNKNTFEPPRRQERQEILLKSTYSLFHFKILGVLGALAVQFRMYFKFS
jgi:hypothetical protein